MGFFDDERTIEVEVYKEEPKPARGFIRIISLIATAILCSVAIFYAVWEVVIASIFSADSSLTERIIGIVLLVFPILVGYFHGKRLYIKSYKFGKLWMSVICSATLIPTVLTSVPLALFNQDGGIGNFIVTVFLVYLCIAVIVGLVTAIVIKIAKRKSK